MFAALINPSKRDTLVIQISHREQKLQIKCDIKEQQQEPIQLGGDVIKFWKYTFTMGGCTIDSERSYVASNPFELNYVYNTPNNGDDLRNHLNKKRFFLKQGRSVKGHYGLPNAQPTITRVIRISQSPSKINTATSDSDC